APPSETTTAAGIPFTESGQYRGHHGRWEKKRRRAAAITRTARDPSHRPPSNSQTPSDFLVAEVLSAESADCQRRRFARVAAGGSEKPAESPSPGLRLRSLRHLRRRIVRSCFIPCQCPASASGVSRHDLRRSP